MPKEIKNQIITEAREKAKEEASKIATNAMHDIENQKKAAITEVKNEIGNMALSMCRKSNQKGVKR